MRRKREQRNEGGGRKKEKTISGRTFCNIYFVFYFIQNYPFLINNQMGKYLIKLWDEIRIRSRAITLSSCPIHSHPLPQSQFSAIDCILLRIRI